MIGGGIVEVVTSGTDWPAVVTTGAVGVAGMVFAYVQGGRARRAQSEDVQASLSAAAGQAALADKREVYARCQTRLMAVRAVAVRVRIEHAGDDVSARAGSPAENTYQQAYLAASESVWIVALSGSENVGNLAWQVLACVDAARTDPGQDQAFRDAQTALLVAMRAELGSAGPSGPVTPLADTGLASTTEPLSPTAASGPAAGGTEPTLAE